MNAWQAGLFAVTFYVLIALMAFCLLQGRPVRTWQRRMVVASGWSVLLFGILLGFLMLVFGWIHLMTWLGTF